MSPRTSIVKLEAQIQPYAWGSHTAIAQLQGRPTPTHLPEAELWIGDHPNCPSRVVEAGGSTPLAEWCEKRAADALGLGREQLPYLVKILAVGEPLSIQLHPNAQQAAEGYAREEAAGVPRGDAQRSYSDPNPKVEALCALERFEALCGLRPGDEVRRLVARSRSKVAADLLAEAGQDRSDEELAGALFTLVLKTSSTDSQRSRQLAEEITRYGKRNAEDSAEAVWIGRLASVHPGDQMLIAPLLLNLVVLERGQLMEVTPNTVHSYLSGTGVEILTNSDNVVRAGLTRKHVARDDLASLLDTRAASPRICRAATGNGDLGVGGAAVAPFPLRLDEFRLSYFWARSDDSKSVDANTGAPRVALCVSGSLELRDAAARACVSISAGEAALIPACVDSFSMMGDAEGFLVAPGA